MKNEDLKQVDATMTKPSIKEPPELKLEELPSHLEYMADYGFVAAVDREIIRDPEREVGYGITDSWDEIVETLQGAPVSTDTELGGYVREFESRVRQDMDEIYSRLDDEQTERQLLAGRLNMRQTVISELLRLEHRRSRETSESRTALQGQITALQAQKQMAPRRTTRSTADQETINATTVTNAQLQEMIDQGVTAALAARDALRSTNGDDSHNSGTGARRTERAARECTYTDFLFCSDFVLFSYHISWKTLMKMMTDKYCPRNEIRKLEMELWELKVKGTDLESYTQRFQELALLCGRMFAEEADKIEKYVRGLPDMIYGSVVASKPKTMQEAIEIATELMDKKILTLTERDTASKRKLGNTSRTTRNQRQQQQHSNKRQNTGRVYTTVGHEAAYGMSWKTLMKMMTDKYCPQNEIRKLERELWELKVKGTDLASYTQRFQELALLYGRMFAEEADKIEKYVGGLPDMIYGSVVASKPKTMQEAIEIATELMDKKVRTFAEREIASKKKLENTLRTTRNQQQQQQQHSNKRQNTGRVYTAAPGGKKQYGGSKPLCAKCNYHHDGPCAPKCQNCNKIGHFVCDCRVTAIANDANN
nr:hypothetical protein [Tanacetum cinerariifolium]